MFVQPLYFTNVTVLTAAGPAGQSVRVARGQVAAIDQPPHRQDRIIDGGGGLMIPGLINAHDHLELNTFARLKYRPKYAHSRAWIEDIEANFDTDPALIGPRRQPLADRLRVSALKNLLSGVTTVCHHNPLHKPLRRGYPIRVVQNYGFCHSLFRGDDPQGSYRRTNPAWPWLIHLAEGVDDEAAAEFDHLDELGLVQPNTVLIHGLGLTPAQQQALIDRGGGLVWCPGSNRFLFGRTARLHAVAAAGKLALGTDSRLTGEADLLTELRLANGLAGLTPQQYFGLVTVDAARLLRLIAGGAGNIAVGGPADMVLLPPPVPVDPFARLLHLHRAQVELVLVGGKPLVGSPPLLVVFEATRTRCRPVWVDGVQKLLQAKLADQAAASPVGEPGLIIGEK
jgi:cytosine/adenosine deaminase-related metal-dependent hydrolase